MRDRASKPRKTRARGFVLGRAGFAKISAVEGVRTTAAMDREFREFERLGLSAAQRRERIVRKYGKGR